MRRQKRYFVVRNNSGETFPAYGIARIATSALNIGANGRIPVYDIVKPDGEDGIYVVNGPRAIRDGQGGRALYIQDATYVRMDDGENPGFSDFVGPKDGKWYAEVATEGLRAVRSADALRVVACVWHSSAGSGGGGVSADCSACSCRTVVKTDITVSGIDTTSKWYAAPAGNPRLYVTNGYFELAAGAYLMEWNGSSKWVADVLDDVSAFNEDGTNVTDDATISVAVFEMEITGGYAVVELTITGSIPVATP